MSTFLETDSINKVTKNIIKLQYDILVNNYGIPIILKKLQSDDIGFYSDEETFNEGIEIKGLFMFEATNTIIRNFGEILQNEIAPISMYAATDKILPERGDLIDIEIYDMDNIGKRIYQYKVTDYEPTMFANYQLINKYKITPMESRSSS